MPYGMTNRPPAGPQMANRPARKPKRFAVPGQPPFHQPTKRLDPNPGPFRPNGGPPPPKQFNNPGPPRTTDQMGPPKPPVSQPPPGVPAAPPPPPANPVNNLDEMGYPLTPGSQARRITADEQLGLSLGTNRNAIFQAALQYGDPEQIAYWAHEAGATPPAATDPSSALSIISHDEPLQRQNLQNATNERGTFFSGAHQQGEDEISTNTGIRRANALRDFGTARDKLMALMSQARLGRDDVYRTTGADDINTYMQTKPEDMVGLGTGKTFETNRNNFKNDRGRPKSSGGSKRKPPLKKDNSFSNLGKRSKPKLRGRRVTQGAR
jgi:hypothetical protein